MPLNLVPKDGQLFQVRLERDLGDWRLWLYCIFAILIASKQLLVVKDHNLRFFGSHVRLKLFIAGTAPVCRLAFLERYLKGSLVLSLRITVKPVIFGPETLALLGALSWLWQLLGFAEREKSSVNHIFRAVHSFKCYFKFFLVCADLINDGLDVDPVFRPVPELKSDNKVVTELSRRKGLSVAKVIFLNVLLNQSGLVVVHMEEPHNSICEA